MAWQSVRHVRPKPLWGMRHSVQVGINQITFVRQPLLLRLTGSHLTTQMLWRSRRLQLLTPRSGIGVEGPPARRGAGL
jgi:hypothetical protein